MTTQTQESLQVPEYKSSEKYMEEKVLEPVGRGIYDFTKTFYGMVAAVFKIPTTIRKFTNDQTIPNGNGQKKFKGNGWGIGMGGFSGLVTDILLYTNMINPENANILNLDNPEYLLYGWLATNLASGLFEMGRFSKSKLEHKILKESKLEKNK